MIRFTVAFGTLIHKEQSITLREILSPTKFTAEVTLCSCSFCPSFLLNLFMYFYIYSFSVAFCNSFLFLSSILPIPTLFCVFFPSLIYLFLHGFLSYSSSVLFETPVLYNLKLIPPTRKLIYVMFIKTT